MADDRELTEMQQEFVLSYVSEAGCIGNAEASAIAAGYSAKTARVQGHQLLTKPHVASAIRISCQKMISVDLVPQALSVLAKIMNDEKVSPAVRVDASKTVLDRGGFGAIRAPQAIAEDLLQKNLSEMTPAELARTIRDARAARDAIEQRIRQIDQSGSAVLDGEALEVDDEEGEG